MQQESIPVRAFADKDEIHLVIADALQHCEKKRQGKEGQGRRVRHIDRLLSENWNPHKDGRGNR
jgi:hypothetical protein